MILPKLKIGRKSDRNYFDWSHDVNTTSDFGFCQPTLVKSLIADSKVKLKTSSFVRLSPLPVPTFGRISVKQHTAFVPYRDVFLAYDAFQAQKSVQSGIRSYVPDEADTLTTSQMFSFLVWMSYYMSKHHTQPLGNCMPFRMCMFSDVNTTLREPLDYDHYYHENYVDPLNNADAVALKSSAQVKTAMDMYNQIFGNYYDSEAEEYVRSFFYSWLQNNGYLYSNDIDSDFNYGSDQDYVNPSWQLFTNYGVHKPYNAPLAYSDNMFGGAAQIYTLNSDNDEAALSEPITLQNADFVFDISDSISGLKARVYYTDDDWTDYVDISYHKVFVCFRLTSFGRRLFKIFNACRCNLNVIDVDMDMTDLLSYYKVWFDKYNPGRNYQWLDTHAYYVIHHMYDFGYPTRDILFRDKVSIGGNDYSLNLFRNRFMNFLVDLGNCFYCLPIDNITVATPDPVENLEASQIEREINVENNDGTVVGTKPIIDVSQPYASSQDPNLALSGGLGIKLLQRIYHYVNKNSILGARIDAYLKAHNLGSPLPDSLVLGDSDFSVFVEDQYSSAETAQGYLGEFAGKAKQFNDGESLHFETANAGTLVQLTCIVPFGGYVQAGKIGKRFRFDFYQALYDSLGKQVLSNYEVNSRDFFMRGYENTVFGFVPQYFNEKVVNNLANGGFAFRSQRATFLPYSLDRIFNESKLEYKHDKYTIGSLLDHDVYVETPYFTEPAHLVPDEELRFIGKYEMFGNYNRIFYDTTGLTDNFILQIYHDFDAFCPMKPVSESFDAFDPDTDNGHVNVSHA